MLYFLSILHVSFLPHWRIRRTIIDRDSRWVGVGVKPPVILIRTSIGVISGRMGVQTPTFWSGDGPPLYKYTSSMVPPLFRPKLLHCARDTNCQYAWCKRCRNCGKIISTHCGVASWMYYKSRWRCIVFRPILYWSKFHAFLLRYLQNSLVSVYCKILVRTTDSRPTQ